MVTDKRLDNWLWCTMPRELPQLCANLLADCTVWTGSLSARWWNRRPSGNANSSKTSSNASKSSPPSVPQKSKSFITQGTVSGYFEGGKIRGGPVRDQAGRTGQQILHRSRGTAGGRKNWNCLLAAQSGLPLQGGRIFRRTGPPAWCLQTGEREGAELSEGGLPRSRKFQEDFRQYGGHVEEKWGKIQVDCRGRHLRLITYSYTYH